MEKKKHKDNSATKHTYPLGQISQLPNKTLKITEEELKYLVTIPAGEIKTFPKPKGIMPQWLSDERRFNEITSAMKRFSEANRNIPTAWITELEQIFTRSQERGKK